MPNLKPVCFLVILYTRTQHRMNALSTVLCLSNFHHEGLVLGRLSNTKWVAFPTPWYNLDIIDRCSQLGFIWSWNVVFLWLWLSSESSVGWSFWVSEVRGQKCVYVCAEKHRTAPDVSWSRRCFPRETLATSSSCSLTLQRKTFRGSTL